MARRTLNRLSAKEAERLKNAGTSFRWWRSLSVHRWRRPAALVFLYVRRGRRVELGLGGGRDMALASARTQATGLRAMLANGEDPRRLVRGTIRLQRLVDAPMLMSRPCILAGPLRRQVAVSYVRRASLTLGNRPQPIETSRPLLPPVGKKLQLIRRGTADS